ncbi:MLP-like protein 34 [Humulus lupulus]|uniref:MLP-like protein 34 n=1 Tax=Humulus lupulus TaxID=3486 RepID=UPI002B40163A|nr:MLP-like protein 34 [Humulus lupulus]
MAQLTKLEAQMDIMSSAEKFYETYSNKQYLLPKICPNIVKDIELIKGGWESVGSIRQCTYVPTGKSQIDTSMIEAKDEKNKSITMKMLGGEVMKQYSSFIFTVQVTKKSEGGGGSIVKLSIECEKQNENVPCPTVYVEFARLFFSAIDAYLVKN